MKGFNVVQMIPLVENKSALLRALRDVDIGVPRRADGRRTDHTERWTMCRLLATLATADRVTYPTKVLHRDKPDFLVGMGDLEIGVEATEACSSEFAHYQVIADEEFDQVVLDPGHFRHGVAARTRAQKLELLRQDALTSPPWEGDSPEREWASWMNDLILCKLERLDSPEFDKFHENWLAVYDNLALPLLDQKNAAKMLAQQIGAIWDREPSFDLIFIEHSGYVVRMSAAGSEFAPLNDVWSC
jgi:hypothetical protein